MALLCGSALALGYRDVSTWYAQAGAGAHQPAPRVPYKLRPAVLLDRKGGRISYGSHAEFVIPVASPCNEVDQDARFWGKVNSASRGAIAAILVPAEPRCAPQRATVPVAAQADYDFLQSVFRLHQQGKLAVLDDTWRVIRHIRVTRDAEQLLHDLKGPAR